MHYYFWMALMCSLTATSSVFPQRSDIAMAITKHDMFDFLIDIVPREEIQMKAKAGKVPTATYSI